MNKRNNKTPKEQTDPGLALSQKFIALAEEVAALMSHIDQPIHEYHNSLPPNLKTPVPPTNPLGKAYFDLMTLATDARMGTVKYLCECHNASIARDFMHSEFMA